jgi:hypothetical protein
MAYDPGRDHLYLSDRRLGAAIYVLANASTASGTVQPARVIGGDEFPLDHPAMISYDAATDRLYATLGGDTDGLAVFDGASGVTGDVGATRQILGDEVPLTGATGGYFDPTQ